MSMQTRVAVLVGWIVEEEVHGAFSLPSEGGAPAVLCQSLGEADNPVSISVFQVKEGFDHLAAEAVADDAGSEGELGQWHSSALDKGKVEIESLGEGQGVMRLKRASVLFQQVDHLLGATQCLCQLNLI